MASLSGNFTGPGVTDSVPYAAGAPVTFSVTGEWPRAVINTEVSGNGGATWKAVWCDIGIGGSSHAGKAGGFPLMVGETKAYPPGSGLFRLRCVEFTSGWCNWTIVA